MSTNLIPDEAIEAAAKAMSAHWRAMHTNEALGYQRMLSRAALTAALPLIREQVARDIEAAARNWSRYGVAAGAFREATNIARGEETFCPTCLAGTDSDEHLTQPCGEADR